MSKNIGALSLYIRDIIIQIALIYISNGIYNCFLKGILFLWVSGNHLLENDSDDLLFSRGRNARKVFINGGTGSVNVTVAIPV